MANTIESDIRVLVRSLAGVTAYIGTTTSARCYYVRVPENVTVTYPYIVYSTVSVNGGLIYLGTRTADALIQFDVYHTHIQDGLDLANALFDGLSAYHGKPSAKTIIYVSCMGPRLLKDPDYDNVYRYVIDAEVRYDR